MIVSGLLESLLDGLEIGLTDSIGWFVSLHQSAEVGIEYDLRLGLDRRGMT